MLNGLANKGGRGSCGGASDGDGGRNEFIVTETNKIIMENSVERSFEGFALSDQVHVPTATIITGKSATAERILVVET